jgi:hypothetical protein
MRSMSTREGGISGSGGYEKTLKQQEQSTRDAGNAEQDHKRGTRAAGAQENDEQEQQEHKRMMNKSSRSTRER